MRLYLIEIANGGSRTFKELVRGCELEYKAYERIIKEFDISLEPLEMRNEL